MAMIAALVILAGIIVFSTTPEKETSFKKMAASDFVSAFNPDMEKEYKIAKLTKEKLYENVDGYFYDFHELVNIMIAEKIDTGKIGVIVISCGVIGGEEAGDIFGTAIGQAIWISADKDEDVRAEIYNKLGIREAQAWNEGSSNTCVVNDIAYTFENKDNIIILTIYLG